MNNQLKNDQEVILEKNLKEAVRRIVNVANPEKIILFGSRGRGDNRPDSDVDLLIIQNSLQPRYQRAVPIRHSIVGLLPSKDIVVYTPQEVEEWKDVHNSFVTTAILEGQVLYEKGQK